ncbi:hypothetical protein COO09_22605 [Rhizorhabdus dicambivorans]|uniref:Uncharacterized protein n=1 Tax=Rhizorhabdus dicambivorans TaxID=1850238 RepID=A0A2A4FPF7_9SPHN|nr:hypothetical protein COO09_22605 [Rhizorhabdus dicambivorans]
MSESPGFCRPWHAQLSAKRATRGIVAQGAIANLSLAGPRLARFAVDQAPKSFGLIRAGVHATSGPQFLHGGMYEAPR